MSSSCSTRTQMIQFMLITCTLFFFVCTESRKKANYEVEGFRRGKGKLKRYSSPKNGKKIPYEARMRPNGEEVDIVEGDIVIEIPPDAVVINDTRRRLNPLIQQSQHWPNGYIPYEINGADLGDVASAIDHFHTHTVLKFALHDSEDNYVSFEDDDNDACWSYMGTLFKPAQVTQWDHCSEEEINDELFCCPLGSVYHELGHMVGLGHTHQREDRDDYITLGDGWMDSPYFSNFAHLVDYFSDCGVYDYSSLMHYPNGAGDISITPKTGYSGSAPIGEYYKVCDGDCDLGDGELYKSFAYMMPSSSDDVCAVGERTTSCVVMGQRDGLNQGDKDCINDAYLSAIRGTEVTAKHTFSSGQSLKTENVKFKNQNDGNLVLYDMRTDPRKVLWASDTKDGTSGEFIVKTNGNLVLSKTYGGFWNIPEFTKTVWKSGTNYGSSHGPYTFGVSDNGFFYLLNGTDHIIYSNREGIIRSSDIKINAPQDPMSSPKDVTSLTSLDSYDYYKRVLIALSVVIFVAGFTLGYVTSHCSKKKEYQFIKVADSDEDEDVEP
eukprot:1088610_1